MTYLDEKVASKEDSIVTIDINAGKIFITDIKSDYSIESTKALIKWYESTEPGQEYKKKETKRGNTRILQPNQGTRSNIKGTPTRTKLKRIKKI